MKENMIDNSNSEVTTLPNFSPIKKRADALDALRGMAVLMMVLSGTIAYRILPAWMYHAQEAPPDHRFNPQLAGLTWVDLVFPLFLSAMGAAIPLALSPRLDQGWSYQRVILAILKRGFFLGTFAIFLQHIRPTTMADSGDHSQWRLALWGFVILFFMFVRLPSFLDNKLREWITVFAWTVGFLFISKIKYSNETGFSLERSDIILIVLTNMAVFAAIIWLFTRFNLWLRLGILGLVFALRLSADADGWVKIVWSWSPAPWIFQFDYLKYLFIVIPATIVGDLIYQWLNANESENMESWKNRRYITIMILMITLNLLLLIGLQARWVWQTSLLAIILSLGGLYLFKQPKYNTEKLLNSLYKWGVYWLILGLLLEPYEGGIKKDSATMSYFFVTTGMAIFCLICLTIIVDIFHKKSWLQIFIDNGMNPMIGYMGFANLIWPIFILNDWDSRIVQMTINNPTVGFFKGVFYTSLVALVVTIFTRFKLFLRT